MSSLVFNENGTENAFVDIIDDAVTEDNETFSIILLHPEQDRVVLNPNEITITIVNDDERKSPIFSCNGRRNIA